MQVVDSCTGVRVAADKTELESHSVLLVPPVGTESTEWQKKGEGRRGSVPRAALVAYFIVYLLNYLLTSVDRVVS